MIKDPLNCLFKMSFGEQNSEFYRLSSLDFKESTPLLKLPFSIRVLLEQAIRNVDGFQVKEEDVKTLACWKPDRKSNKEILAITLVEEDRRSR